MEHLPEITAGSHFNPKLDRYQANHFLGTDQFDPVDMGPGSSYLNSLKQRGLTVVCECGARFHSRGENPCLTRNRNQISRCGFACAIGQTRAPGPLTRTGGDQDSFTIRSGLIDLYWMLVDTVGQLEHEAFLSWELFWPTVSVAMQKLPFRSPIQVTAAPSLLDLSWLPTGGHKGGLSSLNTRLRDMQSTADQPVEGYVWALTRDVTNQGVLVLVSNPENPVQYPPIQIWLDEHPHKFGKRTSSPPYLWLARCLASPKTYPVFKESILYPVVSLTSPLPVYDDPERHIAGQMLARKYFPVKPPVRDFIRDRPYLLIPQKRQVYSSSHQVLASLEKLNAFRQWEFFRIAP